MNLFKNLEIVFALITKREIGVLGTQSTTLYATYLFLGSVIILHKLLSLLSCLCFAVVY